MKHLLKTLLVAAACCMQLAVLAQDDAGNKVDISTNNLKKEPVNMYVAFGNDLVLNYMNPSGIPKFFQFSANSNDNIPLTVQVTISDNKAIQTITQEVNLDNDGCFYEVSVAQYLAPHMANNPEAYVKSVRFINKTTAKVMVRDVLFSSTSVYYPIGINQVFVLDMKAINKRYYIYSSYVRDVNINIYDKTGVMITKTKHTLSIGDNFITFDMLQGLPHDKYVMLITDITNLNVATTMNVMMF